MTIQLSYLQLTLAEDRIRRKALRLRSLLDMKQSAFAAFIGIKISTLANRENGKSRWPAAFEPFIDRELSKAEAANA